MASNDNTGSFPRHLLNAEIESELQERGSVIWTRNMSLTGRSLNCYDKLYVAFKFFTSEDASDSSRFSQNGFARSLGISSKTLRHYIDGLWHYLTSGILILRDSGGRPTKLDSKGVQEALGTIQCLVDAQNTPSKEGVGVILGMAASATMKRRGEASVLKPISKTYLHNFRQKYGLVEAQLQLKSDARIEAEADPRNAYSMICLVKAYCEGLDRNLIMNWDSTQYIVSEELQSKGIFIKAERDEKVPLTAQSSGGLAFAVKMYHLHNASGTSAPPVFVVADNELSDDAFYVKRVEGLGMRSGTDAHGWVCLTKTRACNAPFYRWFCEEVVCPFVASCRDGTYFEDEDAPRFAFVACDGEPRQIEVFQEPTMLGHLDENKVLLVKTPASCSAICQPSDVSSFFKASKKKLAYLPRDVRGAKQWKIDGALQDDEDDLEMQVQILHSNKAVRMKIQTVLQHTAFSPEKKTKVVDAIQRISWAIRETLRESIVMEGYSSIGWGPTPCLGRAMGKCSTKIPAKMSKTFRDNFDNMASIYRLTGALTEAQMDEAGIPSLGHLQRRKVPKDARVLHQQRAVVLNSPRCIAEYRAYKQRKAQELETQRQRRAELADYKARLLVYERWLLTLTEEEREAEQRVFNRGKKRRIGDLVPEWEELGELACPWLRQTH